MAVPYACPHCGIKVPFSPHFSAKDSVANHYVIHCLNCNKLSYAQAPHRNAEEYKIIHPVLRTEDPEEYPEVVRDNFSEAIRSINVGNFRSCIIMTRTALQVAVRDLNAKGSNLQNEIDDLASNHIIPHSIKDWAHEVRVGANLAAHPKPENKVTKEDAEELLGLADAMFYFLYIVPKQIADRKQRAAQTGQTTVTVGVGHS